jgi:hypothetical protein
VRTFEPWLCERLCLNLFPRIPPTSPQAATGGRRCSPLLFGFYWYLLWSRRGLACSCWHASSQFFVTQSHDSVAEFYPQTFSVVMLHVCCLRSHICSPRLFWSRGFKKILPIPVEGPREGPSSNVFLLSFVRHVTLAILRGLCLQSPANVFGFVDRKW